MISFMLTGCSKDEKPVPEQPQSPTTEVQPLDIQDLNSPQKTTQDTILSEDFPDDSTSVPSVPDDTLVENAPAQQDPVTQVMQALYALESAVQRYVAQTGSCKGATLDKLDVSVSLPGYDLSINDKVCVIKAISQQKDTLGTKFSTQLGEGKIYCARGSSGNLCDLAAKQGVLPIKRECLPLKVGGYRIGEIFKDKGFEGKKLTKRGNSVMTIYEAGEAWEGKLIVMVNSRTKRIVALEKKLAQVPLYAVVRAIEKQGNIKLKKRYFSGKMMSAEGKICGKYDIGVAPRSGEYDWAADGGIVTIDIVDKKQMALLDSKMDDLAAKGISL